MKSAIKNCDSLFLKPCPNLYANDYHLFPNDASPYDWLSCQDAYEYTWITDHNNDLIELTYTDKLKLAKSMGFCPHLRCQLGNLTHADYAGMCPSGLCYTKLENGSPSFGACCYIDGYFNEGFLIGYYNKTQATAKPIYKHSRIILSDSSINSGSANRDTYDNFINANRVHPRIIQTQCPIVTYGNDSFDYVDTVGDTLAMIVQQNVTKFIQLAPCVASINDAYMTNEDVLMRRHYTLYDKKRRCGVFPLLYFNDSTYAFKYNVSNFVIHNLYSKSDRYMNMSYDVGSYDSSTDCSSSRRVNHIWYYHWSDHTTPPRGDDTVVLAIAMDAVSAITNNDESIVISCVSGRGRSGTLTSIIVGIKERVASTSSLVDVVVRMREMRDGLVESPAHFNYTVRLLKLSSTGSISISNNYSSSITKYSNILGDSSFIMYFQFVTILVLLLYVLCSKKMKKE